MALEVTELAGATAEFAGFFHGTLARDRDRKVLSAGLRIQYTGDRPGIAPCHLQPGGRVLASAWSPDSKLPDPPSK